MKPCGSVGSKAISGIQLTKPGPAYLEGYRAAIREDAEHRPQAEQTFSDPETILRRAPEMERGIGLPAGYVPSTTLWLVAPERNAFIGEINIRHRLTPALLRYAGHIGYEIRWSQCGKGYGTAMLALALAYADSALGLKRVLITCDDDNLASARVIEKNGGVLENRVVNHLDRGTVTTRRYWIDIPEALSAKIPESPRRQEP